MSDHEINECTCPKCGHGHTHDRTCNDCGGDGFINRYDEDPMWYDVDDESVCEQCYGKGHEHWCPSCGYDLARNPEKLAITSPYDELDR